jgi:hypothetical protein
MKLYATVASERAVKSQGGNKYIDINLYVGSRDDSNDFATLRLAIVDGVYTLWLDGKVIKTKGEVCEEDGGEHVYEAHGGNVGTVCRKCLRTKGEKQKGECNCGRVASLETLGHHDDCNIYK